MVDYTRLDEIKARAHDCGNTHVKITTYTKRTVSYPLHDPEGTIFTYDIDEVITEDLIPVDDTPKALVDKGLVSSIRNNL